MGIDTETERGTSATLPDRIEAAGPGGGRASRAVRLRAGEVRRHRRLYGQSRRRASTGRCWCLYRRPRRRVITKQWYVIKINFLLRGEKIFQSSVDVGSRLRYANSTSKAHHSDPLSFSSSSSFLPPDSSFRLWSWHGDPLPRAKRWRRWVWYFLPSLFLFLMENFFYDHHYVLPLFFLLLLLLQLSSLLFSIHLHFYGSCSYNKCCSGLHVAASSTKARRAMECGPGHGEDLLTLKEWEKEGKGKKEEKEM